MPDQRLSQKRYVDIAQREGVSPGENFEYGSTRSGGRQRTLCCRRRRPRFEDRNRDPIARGTMDRYMAAGAEKAIA